MLDRFPTELITLTVDATSSDAWERKPVIDSLSLVCTSYRIATRPLWESTVHVPRAAVIPLLRSWPAARRKAVVTVFVGTDNQAQALEPFTLRDYSRLLSILPHVKHVYVRHVQESHYYNFYDLLSYQQMWFEMISSNPFRQCLSLCVRQARWRFPPTLESARFKLRRLRLELVLTDPDSGTDEDWGAGLGQFLTTQRLPCLRELRLLCRQVPKISTEFINQLDAAQIDFCHTAAAEHGLGRVREIGPVSAPVLFSFDTGFYQPFPGPSVRGIAFAHMRARNAFELSAMVHHLPDLKALSFVILTSSIGTDNLDSLNDPAVADLKEYAKARSIKLFAAAGYEGDDFVDSGFLDFLHSRGPRS